MTTTRAADVLSLRFSRMKTDLSFGVPHSMHSWNDTNLYVVDSGCLHCWKKSNTINNTPSGSGNGSGCQITTVLSCGNNFIEDVHVDATKIVVSTNCTFRNTTTGDWDGHGGIWVVPINNATVAPNDASSSTTQSIDDQSKNTGLVQNNRSYYSPTLQLYHKRLFNVQRFVDIPENQPQSAARRSSDALPCYFISSSSNTNYQVIGIISDGRYLLVRCKKGCSSKMAILDLYSTASGNTGD